MIKLENENEKGNKGEENMAIRCPKCGGTNIQFSTSTEVRGFSTGQACLGSVVFCNPLGMLCGLCGMGKSDTYEYWICKDCGTKFQQGEYESQVESQEQKIESLRSSVKELENKIDDENANFDEEIKRAEAIYNEIKGRYENEMKEYIASSVEMQKIKKTKSLFNWIGVAAVILAIITFFSNEGIAFCCCTAIAIVAFVYAYKKYDKDFEMLDKVKYDYFKKFKEEVDSAYKFKEEWIGRKKDVEKKKEKEQKLKEAEEKLGKLKKEE